MRILLTGGTGFLGRRLLRRLLADGNAVVLLIRRDTDLTPVADLIEASSVRLIDQEALAGVFAGEEPVQAVIHAATDYGHDGTPMLQPFRVNLELPMRILQLAIGSNVPLFVNIDSFFTAMSDEYDYMRAYRLSKRQFREWGEYVAANTGIAFANMRVFHMYGPDDGPGKFVTAIARKCLAGESIDLTPGLQRRDFIHVDDVVAAVALVASARLALGYHHFDVGSGTSMPVRNFVERVNELCGRQASLNFGALPVRPGEPSDACADPSRLVALGWKRTVDVDTGIRSVIGSVGQGH